MAKYLKRVRGVRAHLTSPFLYPKAMLDKVTWQRNDEVADT